MSSLPISSSSSEAAPHPLEPLFDLDVPVDVVVGTASMTVRDCLRLHRHSVVRLRQVAGAELELSVNGVAIASGEVVIVENSTAIRIASIAEPPASERHE